MANAFWNFVNRFVPGTKADAIAVNEQFDGATLGFNRVEAELSTATSASIAATAAADAATTAAGVAGTSAANALATAILALPKTGGTMVNFITLHANATSALHAVPKQQLDAGLALKVDSASGVFTGNPETPTPTTPAGIANKGYVDALDIAQALAINGLLSAKADLNSPDFNGIPLVPTAPPGTNTGQAASTSFVLNSVAAGIAGVASFNGRTGIVTQTAGDIIAALGYTPLSAAGSVESLALNGATPLITYRDTDLAVDAGGLWRAGAFDDQWRVQRNTAAAGDFSILDDVLVADFGVFTYMGNAVWHSGNLTDLNQLTNTPGYITAGSAPVQSVFGRTGAVTLGLADVTAALAYTPVQQGTGVGQSANAVKIGWSAGSKLKATIDAGDIGNIAMESWVASQSYLTGINSALVTSALGFTPYNATNPSGYLNAGAANALYLPLTGGTMTGDITLARSFAPTQGVLFLGNSGARYLVYDGAQYQMPGANLYVGGRLYANQNQGGGFGIGRIFIQSGGTPPAGMVQGDICFIY